MKSFLKALGAHRLLYAVVLIVIIGTPAAPEPFNDITATAFVANIKMGWNLSNSLDTSDWSEGYLPAGSSVAAFEKGWGNPVTTKANIDAVKAAGFNAIRIPITWHNKTGSAPDYKIRTDWMNRVIEIVNYAVANDMYIIINTHHDEFHSRGGKQYGLFAFTNDRKTESLNAYKKIWEQIAGTFKNYNEKLVFEGLNEPRTKETPNEWSGGTPEERGIINEYYQLFVNTVRASGGNNDKRILMVNPYGAFTGPAAINGLVLPTDTVPNKIIVSTHCYDPYDLCLKESNEPGSISTWSKTNPTDAHYITDPIDNIYNKFVSNGIPVIMGEYGITHKNNLPVRVEWTEFYVTYAAGKGIKCFWWDTGISGALNGTILLNRNNNQWVFPEIIAAIKRGVESGAPPPSLAWDRGSKAGTWTWREYNDSANGGTSTITKTDNGGGSYTFSGNVTTAYEYGFAGWSVTPDAATLPYLKAASSISFKANGAAKTYVVIMKTTNITDYSDYQTTFTTNGNNKLITIPMKSFKSPGWGASKGTSFNKNDATQFYIQATAASTRTGSFSVTISDLKLNQ